MTGMISRRALLGGLASLGLTQTALAQSALAPLRSLRPSSRDGDLLKAHQPPLTELVAGARIDGKTSAQVADLKSGLVLESHNPLRRLPPASVAKAITACYALDVLGPSYRFQTRILAAGNLTNGRLDGNLILAGGGDPTLDTDHLADLAIRLRQELGLTEITGDFLVWDGALPFLTAIDNSQPDQVGYNPGVSGLNLNFNRVHFEWKRSGGDYAITMDARTGKHRPDVRTARMVVEPRKFPIYTYSDKGSHDSWTVARNALGSKGARWLPVRKPALYAAEVFQTMARANGIILKPAKVIKSLPVGTTGLVTHQSRALADILRDMLRYSTNISAECVGMTASTKLKGRVPSLGSSANTMNTWAKAKLGMSNPGFTDHSGLNDTSRISARDMVQGLIAARRVGGFKALLREHPLRDEDRKILEDHPVKVHAKTGTLNFVSGLGGYVDLPDGTELAFACFSADMPRRETLTKAERERPPGGRTYSIRARNLQQRMLSRWSVVYGA